MIAKRECEVRLVCRLPPGSRKADELIEAIRSAGYKVDGYKVFGSFLEAELKAVSLRGDEVVLLIRPESLEELTRFLRVLSRECWYVDVYYHLRGESARKAAENLGLSMKSGKGAWVGKVKVANVSLKVDLYPRLSALTISYRVGWREANRNVAAMIHERILAEKRKTGLRRRLLGWAR